MANATVKTKEVEKVVTTTEKVITLEMTEDEARLLHALIDVPIWFNLDEHAAATAGLARTLGRTVSGTTTARTFFGKSREELT